MPIRPEERARYPENWPDISRATRERADNKCEFCGVENHALGGRDGIGAWWAALPLGTDGTGRLEWPVERSFAWCERDERQAHLQIIRIVLTVAHMDHQPENCAQENLKALCQRCHNRYDAPHRRAGMRMRWRESLSMVDLFADSMA